jgi:cobalt/nickel transport system permease protein
MHHSQVDRLAAGQGPLHHLDPRVKTVATLGFVVAVALVPNGVPERLAAFALVLLAAALVGRLPLGFLLRRLVWVLPFVALPALLLPFTAGPGRAPGFHAPTVAGLLAAGAIVGKALLCAGATLVLVATTPMSALLQALRFLRVPATLVSVVGLLYRYLFVLVDEAERMQRARLQRGGRRLGGARGAAALLGALFLRAHERATQVHRAMLARGLAGEARVSRDLHLHAADLLFAALAAALVLGCALARVPR